MRGVEPKEDHACRVRHFGCWMNPILRHIYPYILEHTLWGCLAVRVHEETLREEEKYCGEEDSRVHEETIGEDKERERKKY
jgi:hypothetical protein